MLAVEFDHYMLMGHLTEEQQGKKVSLLENNQSYIVINILMNRQGGLVKKSI